MHKKLYFSITYTNKQNITTTYTAMQYTGASQDKI